MIAPSRPGLRLIDPVSLRLDPEIQPREKMDLDTINDYAGDMEEGATFPPVVAFEDDAGQLWVADGFHRTNAARVSSREVIAVDVRLGSRRDAMLYAVGCNAEHGFRRTNADKRRAVERLLGDSEWSLWNSSAIGRRCGVSHTFVDNLKIQRRSATVADRPVETEQRTVERQDGTRYEYPVKPRHEAPEPVASAPKPPTRPTADDIEWDFILEVSTACQLAKRSIPALTQRGAWRVHKPEILKLVDWCGELLTLIAALEAAS